MASMPPFQPSVQGQAVGPGACMSPAMTRQKGILLPAGSSVARRGGCPVPYQQLHQGLNHGHLAKAQGNEWAQTSARSGRKASARPASHPRGEQLGPWGAVTAWSLS